MERENTGQEMKKENAEISLAEGFDERKLRGILDLEAKCFPKEWQYEEADKYYREMLEDLENINIFLEDGRKIVGYVLARP